MSKNRRRRRVNQASTAIIDVPAEATSYGPQDLAMFSGFSGANFSPDRGMIYWPSLDTRQPLDSFSRDELIRRIRWLCENEGFIKAIPRNAADLVGYQTPQATTPDEEWNKLAEESWRDSCMTPEVFDHGGKYDYEDAQLMLKRKRYKDGDIITVLTEHPNGRAKVAFYEAHQLRSPQNPPTYQKWKDGILVGAGGKHLAYGVLDPDNDKVTVIPARDVIYSGQFDEPGNIRAIPPLAHAVNHAIDITEVWANLKKAIKASSLFAAVRELDAGAPPPRGRQGLTGPTTTQETNTSGQNVEVNATWNGGQIPRLPSGEKMKILKDERPHPNVRDFVRDLIRDICVGFGGLQSEVIWEMGRLTGPGVRFILDTADRWIKAQQRIDRRWCKRVWVYYIAKEIKSGRLRAPLNEDGTPARWWTVGFTAQRNLTIDRAKESKSRREEIDAGLGTWSGWDDIDGRFWQDRVDQRIREFDYATRKSAAKGYAYDQIFRPAAGSTAPPASTSPIDTAPEEEDDDEEDDDNLDPADP